MFKGFNLKTKETFENYDQYVKKAYDEIKEKVKSNLDVYLCENGNIDGTKIQGEWFPTINTNVFISHSHDDEALAINFAGWLYKEFGLTAFIDSCVWGYANDLLKGIDSIYSFSDNEPGYYDYSKRNFSTSHVHMMLSTALTKMMDKTECVIFLNTSNSTIATTAKDVINSSKTSSPWIYNEIMMSKFIRINELDPERKNNILKSVNENTIYAQHKKANFEYDLDFDHLISLNDRDLRIWKSKEAKGIIKPTIHLDNLYALKDIT